VQSVSRQGKAPAHVSHADTWAKQVEWTKGDVLDPTTYSEYLSSASAVVLTIGSPPLPFVDYNHQLRMNGHTATTLASECKRVGVPRFVALSATMPYALTPRGYYDGKLLLEQAARDYATSSTTSEPVLIPSENKFGSVVLKPFAIYGTRHVQAPMTSSIVSLPLWAVLQPVAYAMKLAQRPLCAVRAAVPGLKDLMTSPVDVRQVAQAAVDGCVDEKYASSFTVIDNDQLTALPVA